VQTIEPCGAGGLPEALEMVAEILRNPTTQGVDRLVSIGKDADRPAELRVAAWCAILDLAWGPPAEDREIAVADSVHGAVRATVIIPASAMAEG